MSRPRSSASSWVSEARQRLELEGVHTSFKVAVASSGVAVGMRVVVVAPDSVLGTDGRCGGKSKVNSKSGAEQRELSNQNTKERCRVSTSLKVWNSWSLCLCSVKTLELDWFMNVLQMFGCIYTKSGTSSPWVLSQDIGDGKKRRP